MDRDLVTVCERLDLSEEQVPVEGYTDERFVGQKSPVDRISDVHRLFARVIVIVVSIFGTTSQ